MVLYPCICLPENKRYEGKGASYTITTWKQSKNTFWQCTYTSCKSTTTCLIYQISTVHSVATRPSSLVELNLSSISFVNLRYPLHQEIKYGQVEGVDIGYGLIIYNHLSSCICIISSGDSYYLEGEFPTVQGCCLLHILFHSKCIESVVHCFFA